MLRFSANLGFLWVDHPLPEQVRRAARAGFDAVELHYPYDTPVEELRRALDETGLPLVSLNTAVAPGAFGLAAVPGSEARARAGIEEALDYARAAGAGAVHVLAGAAEGAEAEAMFRRKHRPCGGAGGGNHGADRAAPSRRRAGVFPCRLRPCGRGGGRDGRAHDA
jgi:2-dehydrotetronate isomerase